MMTKSQERTYLRTEAAGLRGAVRVCEEERHRIGGNGAEDRRSEGVATLTRLEFDSEGRLVHRRIRNPDGSESGAHYSYSPAGLLLKTVSGMKGGASTEYVNEHDDLGRIQKSVSSAKSREIATYSYDERGRKKKTQISGPEDYRPNVSFGGSPFEAHDHAPNLPGGGTATTFYDEQNRPYEIEVRDELGELTTRVIRIYDEKGNIAEETQILPDPIAILPRQSRERILQESGTSAEDLRDQIMKLMAGQSGPHSVKYEYDAQGRVAKTHRRVFNREDTVETSYNDQGDVSREVTRGTEPADAHEGSIYSEAVYSYQYDLNGNWTEKVVSHRNKPDDPFSVSYRTSRTLTYY